MLDVEQRYMIKELYRQGVSVSEIARQTGHDRKTIRSVLKRPLMPESAVRKAKVRKIEPYLPYLEERMAAGVFNAQKLYQEIVALGYPGKARQVRAVVQPYRQARQRQATLRFETEPGQQAQVDRGAFGMIEHQGRRRRLYAFVMVLGWSRMMYVEFTLSTDIAWWLRCHIHAFHYFGGVPREILHDNLKTAVLSRRDGVIHWHPRYLDFATYYGFHPHACQPYRAQTKGKVENGIRYLRHNFWAGLLFTDLVDLNDQKSHWLDTVANVRVHGTTGEIPVQRLAQEGLQPLVGRPDYDTSLIRYHRSSKDCLVSYDGNSYSVPTAFAQQPLMLKETEQGILLILTLDGIQVARHHLVDGHRQRVVQPGHYAGLMTASTRSTPAGGRQRPQLAALLPAWDAPDVEVRPLAHYDVWAEG